MKNRAWSQRHIEELIEQVAKRLGLTGGDGGDISNLELQRRMLGSTIGVNIFAPSGTWAAGLEYTSFTESPGFEHALWTLTVRKQNISANVVDGTTAFVVSGTDTNIKLDGATVGFTPLPFSLWTPSTLNLVIDGVTVPFTKHNVNAIRVSPYETTLSKAVTTNILEYRYGTGAAAALGGRSWTGRAVFNRTLAV